MKFLFLIVILFLLEEYGVSRFWGISVSLDKIVGCYWIVCFCEWWVISFCFILFVVGCREFISVCFLVFLKL